MGIFVSSIRFSFNFILFYFVLNVLFKIRKSSGREVKNRRICIAELAIRLELLQESLYGRKIPLRLDIEPIKKNPDYFIRRYIQYVEEELCGETIV